MDKDFYECLEKVRQNLGNNKDNLPKDLITDIKEKIPDYAEKYDIDNVTVYRKQGFCRMDCWWHYSETINNLYEETDIVDYEGDITKCMYLAVSFKQYSGIYVYRNPREKDYNYSFCKLHKQIQIIIYNHNAIYISKGQEKLIPLTIKSLRYYLDNPYLREFIERFVECVGGKYPIYKDIYRSIKNDGVYVLPFAISELSQYHNPKDLFCGKYKGANSIHYNYNKHSMNLSYLIIKSWNRVREIDRQKLIQITEFPFSEYVFNGRASDIVSAFLAAIIQRNTGIGLRFAEDYVRLCKAAKEKVNIGFKSERKVMEEHDRLSNSVHSKETPLLKPKKRTKFAKLREMLPEKYEWITTRKRLLEEAELQHNCVWGYADLINGDLCQIYSYIDNKARRFTIEFRLRNGRYVLEQIHGKYNQDDGVEKVKDEIENLLAAANIEV